jgi:hypothetical protein
MRALAEVINMKDEELIERFENCTLPKECFSHREHVRVVWVYLGRYSLLDVLARFSERLKNYASAQGRADLYHETITWSYTFLIHERMARGGERAWEEFARNNADLLSWKESILNHYYCEETLRSELAKKTFVFPDRSAIADRSSESRPESEPS